MSLQQFQFSETVKSNISFKMSMKTFLVVAVASVAFAFVLVAAAPVEEKGFLFQFGNNFYNLGNASKCPTELQGQWVTVGNLTCKCRKIPPVVMWRPPTFAWERCKKPRPSSTTETPIYTTPLNEMTGNPIDQTTGNPGFTGNPIELTTSNSDSEPQEPTTSAPVLVEVTTGNSDSVPQDATTSVSEIEP